MAPRGRAVTALVFGGLLAFYVAVQNRVILSYDGDIMLQVARNLVEHGSLRTTHDVFGFNTPYSVYGIGMSLLLAPAYVLQRWLQPGAQSIVTLVNPAVIALTASVVYRTELWLGVRARSALVAALAFGLLTMAPNESTEAFSEPAVALAVALVVLGLVEWRAAASRGPWLVGTGIAVALLFRHDSLVLVAPSLLAIPLFVPARRLRQHLRPGLIVPVLLALAWVLAYNAHRFGTPLASGYRDQGFTTPFWTGFLGLTLSWGKGFFWYNLVLLVGLAGLVVLWKRDRALVLLAAFLVLLRVLVYASWWAWDGGVSWGPRLLFPLTVLFALGIGPAWERVRAAPRALGRLIRPVVAGLAAASAFTALLSVWVPYPQWWTENYHVVLAKPYTFAQVERHAHAYYWTLGGSHIVGNARLLGRSAPFPLVHFVGGPSVVGVTALAVAAVAIVGAFRATAPANETGPRRGGGRPRP